MLTVTSEAGEKNGEMVQQPTKKQEVRRIAQTCERAFTEMWVSALTCTEAQVEAILSEGEST